jgi:ubiquitin carboxyl-terminal hydrolase 4/11/15
MLSDLLSMNLESLLPEGSNHGRVGLINMGNTCYLNSALQCLSNSEDLTKYFLNKYFKTEINNGSLLGSKGFISNQYYNFINKMWNENNTKFCPKEFRINFCRKTQLFMTSEQQDSQEFLLAVLDNLHEDLNRITNKKYMELQKQKAGESDEEASNRWWNYYKSRENSIIVDLFQGQYKSTIKCSTCGNSSISYDTYMNLGLPIPTKRTQIQIKLLTSNLNFIDINIKIDDGIEIKDIIKKAISFINKNNYIEFFRNKNEGDSINFLAFCKNNSNYVS